MDKSGFAQGLFRSLQSDTILALWLNQQATAVSVMAVVI